MNDLIAFVKKYWFLISLICTIISSCLTGLWYLKGEIDRTNETVATTNKWVDGHTSQIASLQNDVTQLQEDERLREHWESVKSK